MAYGLRIVNDESELLIDSEYFSPTFVQKLEFNSTPMLVEAATGFLHKNYTKIEYRTIDVVSLGSAGTNYIVLWSLPDNAANNVWYSFDSSIAFFNERLTCYVYADQTGTSLPTYTLPTAYVYAVNSSGIAGLTSTGPALRMYNAAGAKTFDSNLEQLAPYYITDTFSWNPTGSFSQYGADPVSVSLSLPSNPIFLLPEYTGLRIDPGPIVSGNYSRFSYDAYAYEPAFKRTGTTLSSRLFVYSYEFEDIRWRYGDPTLFTNGNFNSLSVIVADAGIYGLGGGTSGGGGAAPQYQLTSNYSSRDEGTTVVVTLNTVNVIDYSEFPYTVTGVTANDLTAGGTTGRFVILNNTATATFTFANDYLTEGTEVFKLSLDGLSQFVDISVADTSLTPVYSWSTPGAVNEGATGYTTFNATNANGKTVVFSVVAPSAESGLTSISGPSDGTLITGNWTVSGNAATSINVQYSAVADLTTEGPEGFRLVATVDGIQVGGISGDITVNDTSKTAGYSLAATDNWNESNTYAVTITANNVNGTTLYLTTDNALVTPSSSTVAVNSDSFTTNVNFTAGITTANTNVRISLRTGSASGTEVAFKQIVLTNVTPSYGFGAASAFNEGTTGSIQFNYSYAANTNLTFEVIAPSGSLLNGSSDITLTTTTHSVGATNASGSTSVTYSATADSLTEGTEYFRIVAKIGTGVVATSDNITISDTSLTASYSLTRSVSSVNEGQSFTITFATNQSGSFGYTISGVSSADIGGASLTGTVSSGSVLSYTATADATTEGTETFSISLNNGQASTSVTINDTSLTPASYSLTRSVSSVNEGQSFTITFATNQSGSFGYTISGVSSADIGGASLTGTVSNGSVLSYTATADATTEGTETFSISLNNGQASTSVTINDTSLTPAPAYSLGNTWTTLANGAGPQFYLYATNANGTAVTVTKSGTGASRVTISPTSFTISGSSSYTYITVTATMPTTTVAAQSVTISLSTGQSFTFTIDAFTAQAPLVSSVVDIMTNPTYYNGETISYAINMNGAITSDTYVRVSIWINVTSTGTGGSEAGYNIFQGGQSIPGVVGGFPLGTYAGNYTTNPNPGLNTRVVVKARAVTSGGVDRQSDVVGTVRQLSSAAPP